MLRAKTVSPQLLTVLHQLMEIESLKNFRTVGGSALCLQIGHRESLDIDLFSCDDFPTERIYTELKDRFNPVGGIKVAPGVMITTIINSIKVDIVDPKSKFIRQPVIEENIRMAHPEEIAAIKIKITCDPFSGRKTKKDLADIAALLELYSLKEMIGFFKEKYPTMAPYEESVILRMKDFDQAENTMMPEMFNGMTWEKIKWEIKNMLKAYFDTLLKEREEKLKVSKRK
ncbi:MAG: nucleotidyl transferase AbiEii/AbiGii toxin family protein [Bacteroidia bacterium]|nr:nucleotidyl transferase AbiEii/AbiGii toxin family protein [Bacteroidia bacterium]